MSNCTMQGWKPRAGLRLASWMLAVLLVLHGAVPIAHQLSGKNWRPLVGAMVLDSGPTLRPFSLSARSPLIQSEARPNAAPPDRASEQDPPKAIFPVSVQPGSDGTTARLLSAYGEEPRPKTWRQFEARAPPSVA